MKKNTFIILLTLLSIHSFAQKAAIEKYETSIAQLFDSLFLSNGIKFIQTDSNKIRLSKNISNAFDEILEKPESFMYNFAKIKHLGIIFSKDKHVKIYTWNIKLNNGQHIYSGYIQKKNGKKIRVYKLSDHTDSIKEEDVEYITLNQNNWLGMLYYNIIDFKRLGKKYYLLLGYRNKGYSMRNKFIDVLSFSGKNVKFGKRIFKTEKKNFKPLRIVFKYSSKLTFKMNYDTRYRMIIFDHLAPVKSKLKGYYTFYGPDGSYDGYLFEKGKWILKQDVWIEGLKPKEIKKKIQSKRFYKKN